MEIYIMDESFNSLKVLDVFESLIWTERYNGCGNFEFYTPVNSSILNIVNDIQSKMIQGLDCYAWLKDSNNYMIVEELDIKTDSERGDHLTMSGRGLESLLERRIIWDKINLNGTLQTEVKRLIDLNVISPLETERTIPNFLFEESINPYILGLTLQGQYIGENLYDAILAICDTYKLGFDVVLDQNNKFVFSLNYGEDRSYAQNKNPYIVFSPKYENILNSDYLESIKTLKNVTLVEGEDKIYYEESSSTGGGSSSGGGTIGPSTPPVYFRDRRRVSVGNASGLQRRELYTDARDIRSEVDGGTLSDSAYNAALTQRGKEKLAENIYTKVFTGEVEATSRTYVYGEDFFKGDIVQIVNEYGMETTVRISEIVRVQDTNGYSMYPTFQVIT